MGHFLSNSFYTVWKSGHFYKTNQFFWEHAFTHTFRFQLCYLITPLWRWQIYLWLHQIWTQSEKFSIGFARHSWRHLSVIIGLLADSGWTRPQIIIFPLFLLKGNTILPITPEADCEIYILRTVYVSMYAYMHTFKHSYGSN